MIHQDDENDFEMRELAVKQLVPPAILIIILLGLGIVASNISYEDEQIEHNYYCKQVKLWNDNKHLPKEDRPGWPPYNGECNDES